jgi:hypothetical protein
MEMEMERPNNNKQNNIKRAFSNRKVESPNNNKQNNIKRAFQQKGGKP